MPTCNKMSPGLGNYPVDSNTLANDIHQKISRVINTCPCVSGLEGLRDTNKRPLFSRSMSSRDFCLEAHLAAGVSGPASGIDVSLCQSHAITRVVYIWGLI